MNDKDADFNLVLRTEFGIQDSVIEPILGGRNARVWKVSCAAGTYLLKQYFPAVHWDRKATEFAFLSELHNSGVKRVPEPFGISREQPFALYQFIDGIRLARDEVNADRITSAARFVVEINQKCGAAPLGNAAEACFSFADHLRNVKRRVDIVSNAASALTQTSGIDRVFFGFAEFVSKRLQPSFRLLAESLQVSERQFGASVENVRILSPSDFGFHNALLLPNGELMFLDFEYAGWDDPAKLIADFFCQPEIPVEMRYFERFVAVISEAIPLQYSLAAYVQSALLPLYRIKWCCIILNDFIAEERKRREFSSQGNLTSEQLERQLCKAEEMLQLLESAR